MGKSANSYCTRRQFFAAATTSTFAAWGLGFPSVMGNPKSFLAPFSESTSPQLQSWIEINNKIYGARPDKIGPIGGGSGYSESLTKGDYQVSNLDDLLAALSEAKSGQVIFIPAETEIDLTTRI